MRNQPSVAILLWVFVIGWVHTSSVHAIEVQVAVSIQALEPDFLDVGEGSSSVTGPISTNLNFVGESQYRDFSASGSARSDYGSLGSSAQVNAANYVFEAFDSSELIQSQAQFIDSLTIAGSGRGFVEFEVQLSGSAANSHPDALRGNVAFSISVNGNSALFIHNNVLGFYPQGKFVSKKMPITFGTAFGLSSFLITSVNGTPGTRIEAPVSAGVFYSNTASFTAARAFDVSGNLLADTQFVSASGAQYAPVPIPGSLGLMTLSLGAFAVWRRRQN